MKNFKTEINVAEIPCHIVLGETSLQAADGERVTEHLHVYACHDRISASIHGRLTAFFHQVHFSYIC